jgi:hypothetical protein
MRKSCYSRGMTMWDTSLRRVVKIKKVLSHGRMTLDHAVYDVQSITKGEPTHQSEATCCELRTLDESKVGRHNQRLVLKIEKLMGQLL